MCQTQISYARNHGYISLFKQPPLFIYDEAKTNKIYIFPGSVVLVAFVRERDMRCENNRLNSVFMKRMSSFRGIGALPYFTNQKSPDSF